MIKWIVPNLRFPGFEGEWEKKRLGDIAEKIGDGLHGTPEYIEKSNFYFINGNNLLNGKVNINNSTKMVNHETYQKNNKNLRENTLLMSINGTIGNIAKYDNEQVMLGKSVGYFNFDFNSDFLYFLLQTDSVQRFFISELTGTTIKNLSLKTLRKTIILLPSMEERNKVTSFLSFIDKKIQTQIKTIEELKALKTGMSQRIFAREIKFKDENENYYPDWNTKRLGDILAYEQPTNYLVSSTEYNDEFCIPVVTAGKTFILGFTDETEGIFKKEKLPVIIFDDFTTSCQYVNFPFKTKSSAMKILKIKNDDNIKFIYEAMQNVRYEVGGHRRHWISVFSNIKILIPSLPEQQKIANFLSAIDKKIEIEVKILEKLNEQKKFFLQNLFV